MPTTQTYPDFAAELLGARSSASAPSLTAPTGGPAVAAPNPPERGEGADFSTLVKSGFVDHPETKRSVFAAARFPHLPPEERERLYGFKDGELYYVDPKTGERFFETAGAWQKIKRFLGEQVANAPAEVLTAIGAISPVPGGGWLGAGAGEALRQAGGRFVFGEEQSVPERVLKIGVSAAAAKVGQMVGNRAIRAGETAATRAATPPASQAGVTRAMRVARQMGDDVLDPVEEARVRGLMRQYGITEPTLVETTGSRRLADRFSLLGDLPATSDAIQRVKLQRMDDVSRSVGDFLRALSPVSDPLEAGGMAHEAASNAVRRAVGNRTAAATPLYDQAFRGATGKADTSPAVAALRALMDDLPEEGGSIRPVLEKVERMLRSTEMQQVPGAPSGLFDAQGNPILSTVTKPVKVDRLAIRQADNVKKELDALIEGRHPIFKDTPTAIDGDTERRLVQIREALVAEADRVAPGYPGARAEFARLSPPVEALRKGAVGKVADLKGDQVTQATQRLLDSAFTSPETVARARDAIRSQNPAAWDAVVRQWIQRMWEGIGETSAVHEAVNYGGKLAAKMSRKGRGEILKAALAHDPAMLQRVEDFQTVLGRTGLIFRRESQTAARQESIAEMKREAARGAMGKVASALKFDVTRPGKQLGDWIETNMSGPKAQARILDALQDPRAAAELRRLRRLPPRSRKLLEGFAGWLGLVGAIEGRAAVGRSTTPDSSPGSQGSR